MNENGSKGLSSFYRITNKKDLAWIVISSLLVFLGNLFWRRARAGKRGALFSSPTGLSLLILICFVAVVVGAVVLFISMAWFKALALLALIILISGLVQK
ncbi:MAG: hypothetical protein H7Z16_10375 [Pyrinomonadaceae bacterium]|nr:hypothetical protein [Pyrinomonadaceae bacterium]